jgi:HAD superfamily hydrolase (TIGR01509 family)
MVNQARPGPASWVFLDIGNVLWSDDEGDLYTLRSIGRELASAGPTPSFADLEAASRRAVEAYAPSVWRAVIWRFVAPDRARYDEIAGRVKRDWEAIDDESYRSYTRPFPGVAAMLADLKREGFRLALASNNSPRALWRLGELGFLDHFDIKEVSDTLGVAKPDTRFYQALLGAAGCRGEDAVMVGDRLCNDIGPARALGLRTLRVLKGWHRDQQARTPADLPDLSVAEPCDLPAALSRLAAPSRPGA